MNAYRAICLSGLIDFDDLDDMIINNFAVDIQFLTVLVVHMFGLRQPNKFFEYMACPPTGEPST